MNYCSAISRLGRYAAVLVILVTLGGCKTTSNLSNLRSLAEQGNSRAQNDLGVMYANGRGVSQDYTEAVKWYRKAAEQGDVLGQSNLGAMYGKGQGVQQDYAESAKWLRRAAEQGDIFAQYALGDSYRSGDGVPQDYAKAFTWYRKAAQQGKAASQTNLGVMYARGLGVTKDHAEAYFWYSLAAERGDEIASDNVVGAKARLSQDQIAAVDKRVAVWKPVKQVPPKTTKAPAQTQELKTSSPTKEKGDGTKVDAETRMKQLKRLYDQGLIQEKEYNEKRKKILDEL